MPTPAGRRTETDRPLPVGSERRARRRPVGLTLGLLLGLSFASTELSAEPVEIRAAIGLPAGHPVVADGWATFEEVAIREAGNSLTFRLFVNGAVTGSSGALQPLAQGDADMGFVSPTRYPEQFPYVGYLTELALLDEDGLAAAAAMTETALLHCSACAEEFLGQNLVFLGTYSAGPYLLISKEPITGATALQGRQIHTPGSLWDRWVASLGAYPVQPAEDPTHDVLGSGAAEGIIDVALALDKPSISGSAGSVTTVEMGAYRGGSPFTVNRNFWSDLTAQQRKALFTAAAAGVTAATRAYDARTGEALEAARQRGVTVAEPDPDLNKLVRGFAEQDGERLAAVAREREGIIDADELLGLYRTTYAKYVTLFSTAGGQAGEAEILSREIYDKLDPARYGTSPPANGGKAMEK